mmetsp:Transcript_4280/g.9704  ORF Transcript_4280/g.9704 Transcript_4280/m.9704 type:complete len:365 (+) Transcript_4280:619-1713(+)
MIHDDDDDELYELHHDRVATSSASSSSASSSSSPRSLLLANSSSVAGRHTRRNTGGTIYLQNFMTNPDVKATIKCVCGVYRAHIGQSQSKSQSVLEPSNRGVLERTTPTPTATPTATPKTPAATSLEPNHNHPFDVFDDRYGSNRRRGRGGPGVATERAAAAVPTLGEILEFYEAFYERSMMEHDAIIFSLIYVERLIKSTGGRLAPTRSNWRSVLFSCMVLASKVWDDLSMWNNDFAGVTGHTPGLQSFALPRINELELALLECLEFSVGVTASEYAKYYFLIRTMLLRSGLVREDEKPLALALGAGGPSAMATATATADPRDRRSKSMDGGIVFGAIPREEIRFRSGDPVLKDSVCLEQLVN